MASSSRVGRKLVSASMLLALLLTPAHSQERPTVTWSGQLEPARVPAGEQAKLLLTVTLSEGYRIYGLSQPPGGPKPTRITLDEGGIFTLAGPPQQPKPNTKFDPDFQLETHTFEGKVTFTVPVKAAPDAAPGAHQLTVKVTFMTCDHHRCFPPQTRSIEVEVVIEAASAAKLEREARLGA
jgi:DsbC/DsbD-like thiol-disulfide interchange protein